MPARPDPPRNAPGCVGAVLLLVAVLCGLWFAAFAVEGTVEPVGSELPGQVGWDAYVLVALWWGAVAALVTVLVAVFRGTRPASTTRWRMAASVAALVLSVFWPVQAAVLAGYAVTRRSLPRTVRALAVPAGVAVLIAGGTWYVRAREHSQVAWDRSATAATVAGDWHTSSGGRLHLGPDGRFQATRVPRSLFPTGTVHQDNTVDAHGLWSYRGGFTFVLDASLDPAGVWKDAGWLLEPLHAGHTRLLCVTLDLDSGCEPGTVFHRSGPAPRTTPDAPPIPAVPPKISANA